MSSAAPSTRVMRNEPQPAYLVEFVMAIKHQQQAKRTGATLSERPLKRKQYEQELKKLHVELVKLQQWVIHKGLRVCVVFEGRDTAGKGGVIKAMTERVSPRVF